MRSLSWRPMLSATPKRRDVIEPNEMRFNLGGGGPDNKATATVAAVGARAPLLYGRVQAQGLIGLVKVPEYKYTNYSLVAGLYLLVVWGEGEIQQIERIVAGGELCAVDRVDYLGTSTQAADPWLSLVLPGYTDTLRGTSNNRTVSLAYSVFRVTKNESFPNAPQAVIKGLKIYDPREGDTLYSTNPALILADLLTRAGETVNWSESVDAFDYCDELVNDQKRWTCSLAIPDTADIYDHAERLRAYAHCLIDHDSAGIRLVPDKATSISRALTAADIVSGSLILSRPSRRDTPTVVRIGFTDTAPAAGALNGPWGTGYAEAQHPDITTGDTPWIESGLTMPGIQTRQEAMRTAIERLNSYTLRNLLAECTIRDEGLSVAVGDVVSLTHSLGVDTKPMRVLAVDDAAPGRYKLRLEEYDEAVYSDAVTDDPTYPDTELTNPFDVPAPSSITVTEEVFRQLDGTYATRLQLTWSDDDYAYAHTYDVRVRRSTLLAWAYSGPDAEGVTGPIMPRNTYEITVRIIAAIGITGPWASTSHYAAGWNYPPTDVATLNAVEMGGEVRLSWTAAVDTDIWRYEVRWGSTAGDWDSATLLDRVDSLRLVTKDIPAGEWRFYVKALDSIGQYSAIAAWRDVTVTLDSSDFFVGDATLDVDSGASSNVYAHTDRFGQLRAWSEQGTTVNSLWAGLASSYTDLACAYDVGGASQLVTDTWDLGAIGSADSYAGNMTANIDGIAASIGSITTSVATSLNGTSWTDHSETSLRAELAYARVTVDATTGNGFIVTAAPYLRLDVFAREETGVVTTSASGATTVTLDNDYFAVKNLLLSPSGTAPRTAVYDNIDTGDPTTFDVYLFNSSGTQISGDVSWRFQGV